MKSYPPIKGFNTNSSTFELELSAGNIEGKHQVTVVARNPAVGTTVEDVWDVGGTLVYPVVGETWEVVSTDPNDTLLGTGARRVLIEYLDTDFNAQTTILDLNGQGVEVLPPTDCFRFRSITVVEAGSSAGNEGTLVIRVLGGGVVRGAVLPQSNLSQSCHYTVPAGKTAYLAFMLEEINKNEDVVITYLTTLGESPIFLKLFTSAAYQTQNAVSGFLYFRIPEKSDFKATAVSTNSNGTPAVLLQFIEVDNI